jgi:hypothetical protein
MSQPVSFRERMRSRGVRAGNLDADTTVQVEVWLDG